MTCSATLRRNIVSVSDVLWHMGLVASLAVGIDHSARMRFMALQAFRNLAVHAVTGGAAQGRMFTLMLPQLSNLLGVAAQTRLGYVRCKGDLKRSVRVLVTAQTTLYFEVRLSHVALAALRDIVL